MIAACRGGGHETRSFSMLFKGLRWAESSADELGFGSVNKVDEFICCGKGNALARDSRPPHDGCTCRPVSHSDSVGLIAGVDENNFPDTVF